MRLVLVVCCVSLFGCEGGTQSVDDLAMAPGDDLSMAGGNDLAGSPDLTGASGDLAATDLLPPDHCTIDGVSRSQDEADPNNPCQTCQLAVSTTAWTHLSDGTSCGSGLVCSGGACGDGCVIGGTAYDPLAVNPASSCQTCQPNKSTSDWSNLANGSLCAAGSVCSAGTCSAGCWIDNGLRAPDEASGASVCQTCQPATSRTTWSNLDDGTSCASDKLCSVGQCIAGCFISAVVQPAGEVNLLNLCQSCQPAVSKTAWTTEADGYACEAGKVCGSGNCITACYIDAQVRANNLNNPGNLCESCQPLTSTTLWSDRPDGITCELNQFCMTGSCTAATCSSIAVSPTPHPVPPGDQPHSRGRFSTVESGCSPGASLYEVRDLNGDGKLDFVQTDDCDQQSTIGTDHWDVYLGDGTKFAAAATTWALPTGFDEKTFTNTSRNQECFQFDPAFTLADFTGDGRPDLMITDDCDGGTVGWRLHVNSGTGFGAGTTWALPSGYDPNALRLAFFEQGGCFGSDPSYRLSDLSGDGKADLVVMLDCINESETGSTHWNVHLAGASGFADAATLWTLPTGYRPEAWREFENDDPSCSSDYPTHAVRDLTGDGKLDLVVTNDCMFASTVGTDHWLVYAGQTGGFAAVATSWTLPSSMFPQNSFVTLESDESCAFGGDPGYGLFDVNGDSKPDLLFTTDCRQENGIGSDKWEVFLGSVSGFSSTPIFWPLPVGYQQFTFDRTLEDGCPGGGSQPAFVFTDITGDKRPDLVITDECQFGGGGSTVGQDKWIVYKSVCP